MINLTSSLEKSPRRSMLTSSDIDRRFKSWLKTNTALKPIKPMQRSVLFHMSRGEGVWK